MRDPKEMARERAPGLFCDFYAIDLDALADLIREAQEDGARGAQEELCDRLNRIEELEAQVAALTERAERAEMERDSLLRKEAEWERVYGAAAKGTP